MAGAEGRAGKEKFLDRTVRFLNLLRAQVHFDGPLDALETYLQIVLQDKKKPPLCSEQLDTHPGVTMHKLNPCAGLVGTLVTSAAGLGPEQTSCHLIGTASLCHTRPCERNTPEMESAPRRAGERHT